MKHQKQRTTNPLWQKYGHWIYLLVLPAYLIAFFVQESLIDGTAPYTAVYLPLDDMIPFCEWFYIPYVLWYPFMGLVGLYLALKDGDGFKRYMTYIGVSFFTAIALFAIFPTGQDLRPDLTTLGRENFLTRAIATLYEVDTNTNVCPSLHVVGSMAAVFGIFHNPRLRRKWWLTIGGVVLAVLICLSTVFIKQHSIVDVLVGIPYGFFTYGLVYWLPQVFKRRAKSAASPSVGA